MLFLFLPDLERDCQKLKSGSIARQHLNLLVAFLNKHFSATKERLDPLLQHGEITFPLLWALFKPNELIFTTDSSSEQPKCFIYDSGRVAARPGEGLAFEIECRSLDYDGKAFGEVTSVLKIPLFQSAKRISDLEVLPLEFHKDQVEVKRSLGARGRKFVDLMSTNHCDYNGLAHVKREKGPFKFPLKGRVVIDASSFKEMNPNYGLPRVKKEARDSLGFSLYDADFEREKEQKTVKHRELDPKNMTGEQYILCNPTVLGFSLSKRIWG